MSQSGISNGLKSIFFTIVVFVIILLVYASLGFQFFSSNDSFHFGSYGLSFVTFFQMSTFDSWSAIYYINSEGCDSHPTGYYDGVHLGQTLDIIRTSFGSFPRPLCNDPVAQPVLSTMIFISFVMIEGYVLVSMCLATVAIGINERLETLRNLSVYGEGSHPDGETSQASAHSYLEAKSVGGKALRLLGENQENKFIANMLDMIWVDKEWEGEDAVSPASMASSSSSKHAHVSQNPTSAMNLLKAILNRNEYEFLFAAALTASALSEILVQVFSWDEVHAMTVIQWVLQSLFMLDSALRIAVFPPGIRGFKDPWNLFIVVSTLALLVPLSLSPAVNTAASNWTDALRSLRVARLFRVLKTFSFIVDLRIIMEALYSSAMCLFLVACLILLFFSYFALAGMLLFKGSVPYYFSSLPVTLRTLMQVMTQDSWSDLMRSCMLGCRNFGFDTGVDKYNSSCPSGAEMGHGVGYWAPTFFIAFIVMAAMVLCSLLIGVIITSMELLREGSQEEIDIWAKVAIKQRRYKLSTNQMNLLLCLFERTDKNLNGKLTFEELSAVLDTVNMDPLEQFEFFLSVDVDNSGQIDFSEFCEMIAMIGHSQRPETCALGKARGRRVSIAAPKTKRKVAVSGKGLLVRGVLDLLSGGVVDDVSRLAQRLRRGSRDGVSGPSAASDGDSGPSGPGTAVDSSKLSVRLGLSKKGRRRSSTPAPSLAQSTTLSRELAGSVESFIVVLTGSDDAVTAPAANGAAVSHLGWTPLDIKVLRRLSNSSQVLAPRPGSADTTQPGTSRRRSKIAFSPRVAVSPRFQRNAKICDLNFESMP